MLNSDLDHIVRLRPIQFPCWILAQYEVMRGMFPMWQALGMFLERHRTQSIGFLQIALIANECDPLRLPFANCDSGSSKVIQRAWRRFVEAAFNLTTLVLHEISCSVPEVRKGFTDQRRAVI